MEGNYTSACDLWSVGVITYALLSSQVPFFANKRRVLIEKIKKGKFDFKGRRWKYVTQQAKDFVSDLLQVDPEVRPTADEARKSLWLNRTFTQTVRVSDEMEGDVSASIYNFSNYSQLQKLALMIVAHKSSSDEIGFLRKAFEKYEKGAGVISKSEFQTCLVDYGYSTEELDRMFEAVVSSVSE
uniref:Protein kinase domain-containing protein n=1 Tax=Pseudictyota dubia TaxID=2749911 RepID=A0A7R9W389_9STRA